MPAEPRLIDYIKPSLGMAFQNAWVSTVGYVVTAIFSESTLQMLGWMPVVGAGLVGSVALYYPLVWALNWLRSSPAVMREIAIKAYTMGAPVVGAAILNLGFGCSIPLWPCFITAALGVGFFMLLELWFPQSNNQTASAGTNTHQRASSRVSSSGRAAGTPTPRGSVPVNVFMMNHFWQQRPFATAASTVTVDELDERGNVVSRLPSTTTRV